MCQNSQWASMTKRVRSLASMLWDDGDLESLKLEWLGRDAHESRVPQQLGSCCSSKLEAVEQQLREQIAARHELENQNAELREIIRQLKYTALPVVPKAVRGSCKVRSSAAREPHSWLHLVPSCAKRLTRMHNDIIPALESTSYVDGCIRFDLIDSSLASSVLGHAESVIRGLSCKHPAVCKIGLASDPVRRWRHPRYGYTRDKHDHWQGMRVVFVHHQAQAVALLEASLIRTFHDTAGCRNINLGGEGIDEEGEGPYFCYIVYRLLVPPSHSAKKCGAWNCELRSSNHRKPW